MKRIGSGEMRPIGASVRTCRRLRSPHTHAIRKRTMQHIDRKPFHILSALAGALALGVMATPAFAGDADAAHANRHCERQFEEAQRTDMESFRDYDAETFRAIHTEDAVTIFGSGHVFQGID